MPGQTVESDVVALGQLLRLTGHPGDSYYEHLAASPNAELDVVTVMNMLLHPGATFVDVGANIGFETVLAAKAVGADGSVLSFEPSPENVEILRRNIAANHVDGVHVFPFGLSDTAARHTLHYAAANRGGAFIAEFERNEVYEVEEVIETRVLDEISHDLVDGGPVARCDLVKVDIEGHEPHFLRGSREFLATHRPACIMEANHWCLDALTNVTMPDFLAQVFDVFPHVYAFDLGEIVDVRARQMYFMHENIVHSRFANLYCDFDDDRAVDLVARYTRFLQADTALLGQLAGQVSELTRDRDALHRDRDALHSELEAVKSSRSMRAIGRVNRALRR